MPKRVAVQVSARGLIIVAALIILSAAGQMDPSASILDFEALEPVSKELAAFMFVIWGFLAVYLVPKPGAAAAVQCGGALIGIMLGGLDAPTTFLYALLTGSAIDVGWLLFKRHLSTEMLMVSMLFGSIATLPIDMARSSVPETVSAVLAYVVAKVVQIHLTAVMCSLALVGLNKISPHSGAGISSTNAHEKAHSDTRSDGESGATRNPR